MLLAKEHLKLRVFVERNANAGSMEQSVGFDVRHKPKVFRLYLL